uniref:Uncharacterized protein n=1 Tax=viral metagenome TaxID=1070528 RepID=A0A6M3IL89_9ZZZZ
MAKKTVDFKEAKKVAKELNDLMDLDPAIKVTQGKDDLNKDLKKAAGFLEPSDELSKMARRVLTAIGVKLEDPDEDEPEEEEAEEAEEEEEEEEEEAEEEEEEEEEEAEEEEEESDEYADMDRSELKKAIKASKVKKVKEMKIFKSTSDDDLREALRGTAGKKDSKEKDAGMTRSKKGKGTDKKGKGTDKDKASKTRAEIFKALMDDGGGTKKALVKGMQKKYKGGESSESEAQFQVGLFVRLLETMGFVTKNDDDEYVLAE